MKLEKIVESSFVPCGIIDQYFSIMALTKKIFMAVMVLAMPLLAEAQAFSRNDPIGAEQVFETTTAEGWVADRTVYSIMGRQETGGRTVLTLTANSTTKDKIDAAPVESSVTLTIIYTDKSLIIPKENFAAAVKSMEKEFDGHKLDVTFTGDDDVIPLQLAVGQKLPDSEIKADISIEGVKAKMSIKDTNRRISGRERLSLQAGSFDTFILEGTTTLKMSVLLLSQTEKTTDKSWIIPGMGEIKSISYDKKGKIESTTEMISYKK